MIYKTIPIMERADGSLQIDSRNINLRQGDYNFKLQYSTYKDYSNYSPIVNVQVAFRRKDGQQTGWLPMAHIREKEYSINLKNTWFTKEAGILYMTFRIFQTNESNVQLIINTASASLPITPIAQFNPEEEDLLPSEFEVYMSQTNEKFKEVDDELSDLRNDLALTQLGKGIFDNEQELLATYPNGKDYPEGTWAVLLSTNTVWLYNSTTKTWYNSGRDVTDILDLDDNVYRFAKQLYEESKNLFNGDLQHGAYIYANGDFTYTTTYVSNVKPIPVQAGKQIKLSYISSGNVVASGFVFYKSGKFVGNSAGDLATVPSDANQVCFNIESSDNSPVSNYSSVQLEYGDVSTSYQPYNQNRHITNEQADLLSSEWEKQANKLSYPYADTTKATWGMEFIDNGGGRLRVRGTATSNAVFYLKRGEFKLPKGTYTMSSNYYGDGIYVESNTRYFTFLELNKSKTTFTLSEDTIFDNMYLVVKQGYTIDITLELMLNEGTEAFPYQEWNGKIIHEKDIKPVLLWSNGSPNSDMESTDITISDLSRFSKVIVRFKQEKNGAILPQEIKFEKKYDTYCYLISTDVDHLGTLTSRAFKIINSTTVRFGGGNLGNTTSNNLCIPIAIYGTNY